MYAASDALGHTHSTFGLGEDISTGFASEAKEYDHSRSLEVEESLADSIRHSLQQDPLSRMSQPEQPVQEPRGGLQDAVTGPRQSTGKGTSM